MNGADLDICLSRIADGDIDALEQVYIETKTAVYSFAFSILKNASDAEDVLQDTYIKIYQGVKGYRSFGKPMAWILTIVRNLCMAKFNRENHYIKEVSEIVIEENLQKQLSELWKGTPEDKILIKELMESVSEEERHIVILHAVSGFKHRKIAEFLDMPLATVLSKYNRAIKKLRNF